MPKGPAGQKRPGNVIEAAIRVAKIATGEIEETVRDPRHKGGLIGGKSRAENLSPERRSEIAKEGAQARWKSGS